MPVIQTAFAAILETIITSEDSAQFLQTATFIDILEWALGIYQPRLADGVGLIEAGTAVTFSTFDYGTKIIGFSGEKYALVVGLQQVLLTLSGH